MITKEQIDDLSKQLWNVDTSLNTMFKDLINDIKEDLILNDLDNQICVAEYWYDRGDYLLTRLIRVNSNGIYGDTNGEEVLITFEDLPLQDKIYVIQELFQLLNNKNNG